MDQFAAHLDRGWDLVSRGDLAGALRSAEKSLELDAESPEAHNLMGYIRGAEGNVEDALQHYRHAIEIDETFVEAMLNAAEVLIHPVQDYDGAIDMVEEALDYCQTPDEIADALLLKVDALMHMGGSEKAAPAVGGLPEGPFENPHVEFLVGRAKFEVGDLDGAQSRIVSSLLRDGANSEAHYYMGLIWEARGDASRALEEFLRSRSLDLQVSGPPWSIPPDQFEKRVREAIARLPEDKSKMLEGALVAVGDVPGVEVIVDGVDPRSPILLEDVRVEEGQTRVSRMFVYQRNLERMAGSFFELEEEIFRSLDRELTNPGSEESSVAKGPELRDSQETK